MRRQIRKSARSVLVDPEPIGLDQRFIEMNQDTVEIDWQQVHRPNGVEGVTIGEPARAEIPPGFRTRAQVAEDLSWLSANTPRRL